MQTFIVIAPERYSFGSVRPVVWSEWAARDLRGEHGM